MNKERIEKLAVAQALYNELGRIVSTRDADSLRAEADGYFVDLYKQTGAKSFEVTVGGEKVGTYSVRVAEPKDMLSIYWEDQEAVEQWAIENGFIEINEAAIQRHFEETGELPPSGSYRRWETPRRVSGGTLKVDAEKVKDALRGGLPSAVVTLVEEGDGSEH